MQKTVYGFDKSGDLPFVALHVFRGGDDGQLEHYIDGKLRATVPPEGWEDYVQLWPDAADVVDSLRIPVAVQELQDATGDI